MDRFHPLDVLRGYRLGSRQATVELQRTDVPSIHIDFDVFRLVQDVQEQAHLAVILSGTAGDGKTYLAYRIIDALGLDRTSVSDAQKASKYDQAGVYIDLDLSAGALSDERVRRLHHALSKPQRLTLICANEGKLSEFEERLRKAMLPQPKDVLRINLSQRALVSPDAWSKVLEGVLNGPLWDAMEVPDENEPLSWNRSWLADPAVAERLRRYLLLPYLLGEPITVRETLSFLTYALGGGRSSKDSGSFGTDQRVRYLLFNTVFGEPEGYEHGGRATPNEKLQWWLFRFDPADQASPEVDLKLLVELNRLHVAPPQDLCDLWQRDLVILENENTDTAYRRRLGRFITYVRRWYALASEAGFSAYFPFQHFEAYLDALNSPSEALGEQIPILIRGLNLLLSGGRVSEDLDLRVFYLTADGTEQNAVIYSTDATIDSEDFRLVTNLSLEQADGRYLELLPRRLYLQYTKAPDLRLPVSLLLYEVLCSAASPAGGFPATFWATERSAVVRFMSKLSKERGEPGKKAKFTVVLDKDTTLNLDHRPQNERLRVERW